MRLAIAVLILVSAARAEPRPALAAELEDLASRPLNIAEPMVFDLVCDLGAVRGTAEVNVLSVVPLDSDDPSVWEIAPEFEYAVADGFALELELPFEDGGLESIKFGAQYTFGRNGSFIHGTQVIVERLLHEDAWDAALLYIPAYRFNDTWSSISLLGIGALVGNAADDEVAALINSTLLADLTENLVLGFEVNLAWVPNGATSLLLMPQLHIELTANLQLQIGVGVLYLEGDGRTGIPSPGSPIDGGLNIVPSGSGWYPQAALRLIYNF